jgi:hypothetical protein
LQFAAGGGAVLAVLGKYSVSDGSDERATAAVRLTPTEMFSSRLEISLSLTSGWVVKSWVSWASARRRQMARPAERKERAMTIAKARRSWLRTLAWAVRITVAPETGLDDVPGQICRLPPEDEIELTTLLLYGKREEYHELSKCVSAQALFATGIRQ